MEIRLNGKTTTIADASSVAQLLQDLNIQATRIAVLVNEEIIAAGRREQCTLKPGDQVEIIGFAEGG